MANYATQTDMEDLYGEAEVLIAADRDGSGVVDPEAMASALVKATSEMNSYIGVRYDLPLAGTNEKLEEVCCEISMYRLSADSPAYTEEKRVRYDDAIKWLCRLADGKATLGIIEESEDVDAEVEVSDITQVRQFTRTKMQGLF